MIVVGSKMAQWLRDIGCLVEPASTTHIEGDVFRTVPDEWLMNVEINKKGNLVRKNYKKRKNDNNK